MDNIPFQPGKPSVFAQPSTAPGGWSLGNDSASDPSPDLVGVYEHATPLDEVLASPLPELPPIPLDTFLLHTHPALLLYLREVYPLIQFASSFTDWRVGKADGEDYLLIPLRDADGQILAVRGLPMHAGRPSRIPPKEYTFRSPPHEVRRSVVTASSGALAYDLLLPFQTGTFDGGAFDRPLVWVSRDPVDGLLLQSQGFPSVSLATPCATLGWPAMIERLLESGALTRPDSPRGTLVVVDPQASLSEEAVFFLREFFQEVLEAGSAEGKEYFDVTGRGLAEFVRLCRKDDWDSQSFENAMLFRAREIGLSHGSQPEQYAPRTRGLGHWEQGLGPIESITAEDLLAVNADDEGHWLVDPFLAFGAFTDVQGIPFAGKTTFLLSLVSAVSQGTKFLGRDCKETRVVYVTEQVRNMMKASAREEPGSLAGVHFVPYEKHAGHGMSKIVEAVRDMCRTLDAGLVVFDTVFEIAGLTGEQAKSDGFIRGLYRTLRPLTADGVAVLIVRHGTEGSGSLSTTGAGSVAVSGGSDVSVRLRESAFGGTRRRLEIESRLSRKLKLTVDRTSEGWIVVPEKETEPKPDVAQPDFDAVVLAALDGVEPPGLTSLKVVEKLAGPGGTGPKRFKVDQALARLMAAKKVVRERATVGKPYRHSLTPEPHLHLLSPPPL